MGCRGHMLRSASLPILNCGDALQELYARGELMDVVIRVEDRMEGREGGVGEQLLAHSCVLAATSPVLRKMLTGGFRESRSLDLKSGMRVIALHEVSSLQVKQLLEWIYMGCASVDDTHELMLLGKLADVLDVQPLYELVIQHALSDLSGDTCAEILQCAHDTGLSRIKHPTLDYALKHFDVMATSTAFTSLSEDLMRSLLASDHLQSTSEETIYEHVLRWMLWPLDTSALAGVEDAEPATEQRERNKESTERAAEAVGGAHESVRGEVLRHVRFPLMDGQYLALEIHQKTAASKVLQECCLLKSLTTEAALWQIVPAESKHLFKLQHLEPALLQPRCRSWSSGGSRIRHVLRGHREEVQALKICEHKLISGSVDWSISVWNTSTWHCEAKLLRHQAAVCALEADKQRLYSGSVDRSVCVWDLRDWSCLQVLVGHSKSVFVLKALGNWLLSGSDDGSIKVWDIRHMAGGGGGGRGGGDGGGGGGMPEKQSACRAPQHPRPPTHSAQAAQAAQATQGDFATRLAAAARWNRGGNVCSRASSACQRVPGRCGGRGRGGRETAEREVEAILTLTEHSKAVCALEAAGEYVFSGSFDATIRVWHRIMVVEGGGVERETLVCKKVLTGHEGGVCTMAICAGRLISGSTDIRVWNLETLSLEHVLQGHNGGVNELTVVDDKLLGGFDDALIRVWDSSTWQVERVLEGHVGAVYAIALDESRLYSASFDKCIRVWY